MSKVEHGKDRGFCLGVDLRGLCVVLVLFVLGIWGGVEFFFFTFYNLSNEDQNILMCPERLLERFNYS